jgi:S1-C subfamily serine protease
LITTAVIAGIIGAVLVLLVFPAAFGVNPYDLIRGKVKKAETTEETSVSKQVTNVVSPSGAMDVSAIAKKVTPSIVNINVSTQVQSFPGLNSGVQEGTGSGIIYTSDGYILTDNHVVGSAQTITVTLADGEQLKGTRVGTDPETDVAVVKIDKTGLPAISIGNSDTLVVGQLAVAVGSPFGFEQSVTSGIISALHRNVPAQDENGQTVVLTDMIQTDAPINPGNSGGALTDSAARLVGINTLIASSSGGSEGVGFATPVNTAKAVADDIIAGRSISHPYIGVAGQTVSENIASQYNLPVTSGAYVTNVVTGGPADKAGIKSGNIIVAINGQSVSSMDDLIAQVRRGTVGNKVTVTYYSGKDKKTTQVTLEEKPTNLQ